MTQPAMAFAPELRGNEVLLVVEDEEGVRSLIGPAHAVISDLVMPELGGAPLIEMLHAWYPALKVLLVSGYSEDTVASKGAMVPGARYLAKPFSGETLARTVRHLLDSAA